MIILNIELNYYQEFFSHHLHQASVVLNNHLMNISQQLTLLGVCPSWPGQLEGTG